MKIDSQHNKRFKLIKSNSFNHRNEIESEKWRMLKTSNIFNVACLIEFEAFTYAVYFYRKPSVFIVPSIFIGSQLLLYCLSIRLNSLKATSSLFLTEILDP